MPKIIFRLKSGFELPVTCETYSFKTSFGTLEEYTLKGVTKNKPLVLPCDDIECVWEVGEEESE